jgi:flagellar biosynthesis/type III secretory pathway chaperone
VKVLITEEQIYQTLIEYAQKKTEVLIRADVPALEQLTNQEQLISDQLNAQGNQQKQLLQDIAVVLGKTSEPMTVTRLIGLLDSQPKVQTQLINARDHLIETADKMKTLNDQNIVLIQQAIELNEFDLTLFKSMRQAPETANYDKSACNTGALLGSSGFDATS